MEPRLKVDVNELADALGARNSTVVVANSPRITNLRLSDTSDLSMSSAPFWPLAIVCGLAVPKRSDTSSSTYEKCETAQQWYDKLSKSVGTSGGKTKQPWTPFSVAKIE